MVDPEEVDGDSASHKGGVCGEADPPVKYKVIYIYKLMFLVSIIPGDLLPRFHLQIAEDVDADEESGDCTGEMSGVTHLRIHILNVVVVKCRTDVDAHQDDDKQQAPNGKLHLLPILLYEGIKKKGARMIGCSLGKTIWGVVYQDETGQMGHQ